MILGWGLILHRLHFSGQLGIAVDNYTNIYFNPCSQDNQKTKIIMTTSFRIHYFHLIWSTKGRRNYILPKMQEDLYKYIGGIIRKNHGTLLEIGGIENHIHLLLQIENLEHFNNLVRNAKAYSTIWIKKTFPLSKEFSWQKGYGSYSVSCSQLPKVREYIRNQERHHKGMSFEEEFKRFLDVCGVSYDEKYVFDEG